MTNSQDQFSVIQRVSSHSLGRPEGAGMDWLKKEMRLSGAEMGECKFGRRTGKGKGRCIR